MDGISASLSRGLVEEEPGYSPWGHLVQLDMDIRWRVGTA